MNTLFVKTRVITPQSFIRQSYSTSHLGSNRDNLPIIKYPACFQGGLKKIKRAIGYEDSIAEKKNKTKNNSRVRSTKCKDLTNYTPKRHLQEFPGVRYDNTVSKDYVIVLPEAINENPESNEILRATKAVEPEIDFSKLSVESTFKGLSQVLHHFENYVIDANNETSTPPNTLHQLFKDIEKNLYPMDTVFNVMSLLLAIDSSKFAYKEIHDLLIRYYSIKDKRLYGVFKETIQQHITKPQSKLTEADKKMLKIYQLFNHHIQRRAIDESSLYHQKENLRNDLNIFIRNLVGANELFSHTVDDPDILAAVSTEFDECQNLHHKERTPLRITNKTYHRFLQVCPDRFVRQMLWQTYNKRCSPKALPKFNNSLVINNIRVLRRKLADLYRFRSHVELKLADNMASSRQVALQSITALNEENRPKLLDRLKELNDFAADNSFEDPSQLGIQEYDVDYWSHKYMHDILIGLSKSDLRNFFPLDVVMLGVQNYFKNYYNLELRLKKDYKGKLWSKDVQVYEVLRKNQPLGLIFHNPYQETSYNNKETNFAYGRIRARNRELGHLPARFIDTRFKRDESRNQAYLTFTDIINLFHCYAIVIQRLFYNYDYYELNVHGALEAEAKNLFPNLCVAHLLTDHRILQSCSDRGGSKSSDAEIANRILTAFTYFRPLNTWQDLYKAHLDLEAHTTLSDTKNIADSLYTIYSPFSRDPDSYDYCSMNDIFVGPDDGIKYSGLWSKQLANFCLTYEQANKDKYAKPHGFYDKLLDVIFDSENFNTNEKLISLMGQSFEPTKASLGVL